MNKVLVIMMYTSQDSEKWFTFLFLQGFKYLAVDSKRFKLLLENIQLFNSQTHSKNLTWIKCFGDSKV